MKNSGSFPDIENFWSKHFLKKFLSNAVVTKYLEKDFETIFDSGKNHLRKPGDEWVKVKRY